MKTHLQGTGLATVLSLLLITVLWAGAASAHCDGLDGPVVNAARKALNDGDVNLALIWVQEGDEREIRHAFQRTLAVRELGRDAKELADMYFFEALVRIHRAGEGVPYTGLKPAGRDLGPAIPLADRVLITGKIDPLVALITNETAKGVVARFKHILETRDYATSDVEAGRKYVGAYVTFIHYVDGVYEAATQAAVGHFPESPLAADKHHD